MGPRPRGARRAGASDEATVKLGPDATNEEIPTEAIVDGMRPLS